MGVPQIAASDCCKTHINKNYIINIQIIIHSWSSNLLRLPRFLPRSLTLYYPCALCLIYTPSLILSHTIWLSVCVYVLWDAGLREGLGPEAQHREDNKWGKYRGEEVDGGDSDGITVTVIVALVVGGVRYDRAKTQTQSKEHLSECLTPHLYITPNLQLRERGLNKAKL